MVIEEQNKMASSASSQAVKGSLMKKKRKIHIGSEKTGRKTSKYSTETISMIGLVLVALLNLHLHYNVRYHTKLNTR